MKRAVASILIILGCVVFMPNTHAQPSPSPKRKPTRLDGTIGQSVLGQSSGGSYNPMPPPHGYVGRNDGRVQQSMAVGKPSPRNLTTNAKPSSEITANAAPPSFVGRSSGVAKQTGAGAHKTKGPQEIATQSGQAPAGHYIGLDHTRVNKSNVAKPPSGGTGKATTAHHASGSYSARVGSTAGAKETGAKVSRTPGPR
jgi:hypothetical protein